MQDDNILWTLFMVALPLSFLSIGGGASILAPLQHEVVEVYRWIGAREYIDIFALSRAAPGPGSIIVTMVGWKVAGWPGAVVASMGIFFPSAFLCYAAVKVWNRYRGTEIHTVLEKGLAPIGLGMLSAGGVSVLITSDTGWLGLALAIACTAFMMWKSIYPLLLLVVGSGIYLGLDTLLQ